MIAPRADAAFMLRHPARWIALGFGSGLAPRAPGTVGTLWGWLSFAVLAPWLGDAGWGLVIAASFLAGVWACTLTARHLGSADPDVNYCASRCYVDPEFHGGHQCACGATCQPHGSQDGEGQLRGLCTFE